ncbi:MAG: methylenetetrahydrofolate reductase [NAD(P)H] [Deltaproteobacteria bacterium]|nr:methylenetetrahydrofolate reductase [NAD(P)H] [Deltaproteobacteria bacterium]
MDFRDYYQPGSCRISFEVFPPKDEEGMGSLLQSLKDLSPFKPAFVSCTYGAMGTTRDVTRDLVIQIRKELDLTTAFHFTCVGSNRIAIKEYVEYLKEKGINLVVALRGDPPQGSAQFVKPADGFSYANELVAFLKSINGFSIAVAGYPEGHIEAPDLETDLQNLKRKVAAGADVVLTQLFFDNRFYFDFVERARKIGITVPIVPGIMPILSVGQIEKITRMCGASIPKDLYQRLSAVQEDHDKVREIGIEHASAQCRQLLEAGVPGIHFYTLNRSYSTRRILESLSL